MVSVCVSINVFGVPTRELVEELLQRTEQWRNLSLQVSIKELHPICKLQEDY
jgi:hypothetical protein